MKTFKGTPQGNNTSNNSSNKGLRVNEQINAREIRLIGSDGEMLGVVSVAEGLARARDEGLDLVEIAPNSTPPVCKVLDHGKYIYEIQKKAKEAKKKQKVVHIKEIKMRPNTDVHDYEVKLRAARRFIEAGDKVKVSVAFRGREIAHVDLGYNKLDKFKADVADVAKIEQSARMEGKQLVLIIAPQ